MPMNPEQPVTIGDQVVDSTPKTPVTPEDSAVNAAAQSSDAASASAAHAEAASVDNDGSSKSRNTSEEREAAGQPKLYNGLREEECTTLMMRNIPNKYSQRMVKNVIEEKGFKNTFDFLYVPCDFSTRVNVGYCFINFIDPKYAQQFARVFHRLHLSGFKSKKLVQISLGTTQGLKSNIAKFEDSTLCSVFVAPEFHPLIIDTATGEEICFRSLMPGYEPLPPSRVEDPERWAKLDAENPPKWDGDTLYPRVILHKPTTANVDALDNAASSAEGSQAATPMTNRSINTATEGTVEGETPADKNKKNKKKKDESPAPPLPAPLPVGKMVTSASESSRSVSPQPPTRPPNSNPQMAFARAFSPPPPPPNKPSPHGSHVGSRAVSLSSYGAAPTPALSQQSRLSVFSGLRAEAATFKMDSKGYLPQRRSPSPSPSQVSSCHSGAAAQFPAGSNYSQQIQHIAAASSQNNHHLSTTPYDPMAYAMHQKRYSLRSKSVCVEDFAAAPGLKRSSLEAVRSKFGHQPMQQGHLIGSYADDTNATAVASAATARMSMFGQPAVSLPPASMQPEAAAQPSNFDGFAVSMTVPVTRTRRASIAAPPGLGSNDSLGFGLGEIDYQHDINDDYRPSFNFDDLSPTAATFGLETPGFHN